MKIPAFQKPTLREEFTISGVDIDVNYDGDAQALADKVLPVLSSTVKLSEIQTVRGEKVWPEKKESFYSDVMTLRFTFDKAADQSEGFKRGSGLCLIATITKDSGLPRSSATA